MYRLFDESDSLLPLSNVFQPYVLSRVSSVDLLNLSNVSYVVTLLHVYVHVQSPNSNVLKHVASSLSHVHDVWLVSFRKIYVVVHLLTVSLTLSLSSDASHLSIADPPS